jgi:diguanylate cyclase (GGDEF)-like protein
MSSDPRKDLSVLRRVTQHLSQEHTLEYALQEVTDAALDLLPGDHASIRVLDAPRRRLLAAARSGAGTEQRSLELCIGEGVAGWVIEHARPAHVRDVHRDPRFVAAVGQGFSIGSMVVEPLMSAGTAMGVLSVSASKVNAFTDADEQLACILANCTVPLLDKARLERLTLVDELTLAFNANYLRRRLGEEMDRARHSAAPLSLLVFDLDHLDRTNQAYGRDLGDNVLSVVSERVRSASRRYDAFIRWGGDEFVLLLPATNPTQALATAERLRAEVGEVPMEPRKGGLLTQTISVGVATWNVVETPDELLERAARGVTLAKGQGGNRVARAAVPGPDERPP